MTTGQVLTSGAIPVGAKNTSNAIRSPVPSVRTEDVHVVAHHILRPVEVNRTLHLDLTTLDFFWMQLLLFFHKVMWFPFPRRRQ